jgi:hypothetical protein
MNGQVAGAPLESIAHIIQTALTPVFLLTGVATLLNTISTRLARVNDNTRHVADQLDNAPAGEAQAILTARLAGLNQQNALLIAAMVLAALAGTATCGAILTLFVGALRDEGAAAVLFALFGIAVACTTGTLIAFLAETVLSWRALRVEAGRAGAWRVPDL